MKRLLPLLAMLLLSALGAAHAATPLPGDSVYNLPVQLTGQDGRRQMLAERRGRPQQVTMFYTSCTMVCPMIIDTLRLTRNALDPQTRARLGLLAVSFDPANDDVAALKAYAGKRKLDPRIWTLARAEPAQVRQLSGVLGLQYRQLPDGEFNHSSELILLDAEGRIAARTTVIGRIDPAFVKAIDATVATP
ncbi:MAG: SCO family protein [Rhodanobacter sp.]